MFANNPWKSRFWAARAFVDFGGRQTGWTGDRREFIGRNGTYASPAALVGGTPLSNTVGAVSTRCGVLRTTIELPAHSVIDVVFFLGKRPTPMTPGD